MKLTNAKIKNLQPPIKGQSICFDEELRGFGVRITELGTKSFIVQSRVNGKTSRTTLGAVEIMDLGEARKRAMRELLKMRDGIDPAAEKKKQKALSVTLRDIALDYVTNKRTRYGRLRPSSVRDIEACTGKYFKEWAGQPVNGITRDKCIRKFRELSVSAPIQTNLAFRNLRALLNWARETYATNEGEYTIVPVNPVTRMLKVVKWNPERPRNGRIPKNKIGVVYNLLVDLRDTGYNTISTTICADLILFLLLTGTRISEASKLTWDHIRLFDTVPTFHLSNTKNHNPVTLPISDPLLDILRNRFQSRTKNSNYVFPSQRGKTPFMRNTTALFKKISEVAGEHQSNHNLRRTFEDMCQSAGVDSDKRRQLLNHLASDVHGQAYANNPDPAELMPAVQAVGQWIVGHALIAKEQKESANIIPIRA